ncbi:ArdC family protein [Pedobacter agri]|uniref:ArdC family protein n=1 Tax=Pedobacter agri TaxID=454586 RepID=UPI00278B227B|nr:zincin-like metallopeptidase domain-containing protein [Pedobacter agri]MDQ1141863.1 antirestriction protein ArdC [Pedobacter agri]
MMENKSRPLHEQVASTLIEQLKKGTAPWQKPWDTEGMLIQMLPYNAQSGNRYKGINAMNLLLSGYEDPRWLTFKQAESMGAKILKGEKGTMIQFVKTHEQKTMRDEKGSMVFDELGNPVKQRLPLSRPIVSSAWVFNAQQISGLEAIVKTGPKEISWDPMERAEALIKNSSAEINHRYIDSAYYDVRYDAITLPERSQFAAADLYYATALHELAHWTGHPSRLDRASLLHNGMIEYSKEELRAEIASMLIGSELRIGHDPGQHAAYVDSWVSVLEDTPFEIHAAAADAEKIFEYLLAIERKQSIELDPTMLASATETPRPFLSTGDEILYKDRIYRVEGHLKQGRLRMEQLPSGIQFTLSSADPLYGELLEKKIAQHPLISLEQISAETLKNNLPSSTKKR